MSYIFLIHSENLTAHFIPQVKSHICKRNERSIIFRLSIQVPPDFEAYKFGVTRVLSSSGWLISGEFKKLNLPSAPVVLYECDIFEEKYRFNTKRRVEQLDLKQKAVTDRVDFGTF
jgi:hypothetical protein